jgi:poly(A) polymerase
VYGSQAEDAARRDFTINALYFDPSSEEVWDYVGGVVDIRARRLKLIGPPVTRFREDPVRMLRAVRLAAKGRPRDRSKTAAPIPKLASLVSNVPPARLFDEMQKLLLSGHAAETLASLRAHGLSHGLCRCSDMILEQPLGTRFIEVALAQHRCARARRQAGVAGVPVRHAPVARSAAAMEHRQVERRAARFPRCTTRWTACWRRRPRASRSRAGSRRRSRRSGRCSRASSSARAAPVSPARARALPCRVRLPALRAESGEAPTALVDWWTRFQDAPQGEREAMLRRTKRRARTRRSRGPRTQAPRGGRLEPPSSKDRK